MAMQRPAWTICFFFIFVLMIPGTVLTHWGVSKVLPPIQELPKNVIKGFQEVFKFAYLAKDSKKLTVEAGNAIKQCYPTTVVDPAATSCPNGAYKADLQGLLAGGKKMDAKAAKAAINLIFSNTLGVVNKVANDKYFGNDGFKSTGKELSGVTVQLVKIEDTSPCHIGVPAFCEIYNSGDKLVGGMSTVNAELNKLEKSDMVKQWDDNKGYVEFLHALPYFMVLAMLFFTVFWWFGGICCCCKGGTTCGTLALIPMMLLWLASFTIYFIVLATGAAIKMYAKNIAVPTLKDAAGKHPSLEDVINHLQTKYPEFWKTVFADLSAGLQELYQAAWFFTVVAILIFFYSCCECCWRPYFIPVKEPEPVVPEPEPVLVPEPEPVVYAAPPPAPEPERPDVEAMV